LTCWWAPTIAAFTIAYITHNELTHALLDCGALQDPEFLLDVLVSTYQRRASQRAAINAMPIYPTEGLLWDTTQVRHYHRSSHRVSFAALRLALCSAVGRCCMAAVATHTGAAPA
jgi:hypothetical protein